MFDFGSIEELWDRTGIRRLNPVKLLRKQWKNFSGRIILKTDVPKENMDIPYVSFEKEGV